MAPFNQTFLLVQSLQTEVASRQSTDYVQNVFATVKDGSWGVKMEKQRGACSNPTPNTEFH